jgi:hypothetical protein
VKARVDLDNDVHPVRRYGTYCGGNAGEVARSLSTNLRGYERPRRNTRDPGSCEAQPEK